MSFNWDFSDLFLMIGQRLWALRRKTTKVRCHFHHIISKMHTINMTSYFDIDLDYLAEILFVRFLYSPYPFFHAVSLEGNHYVQLTLEDTDS